MWSTLINCFKLIMYVTINSDCYSLDLGAFPVLVSESFTVCSRTFVT